VTQAADAWSCGVVVTLGGAGALLADSGRRSQTIPAPEVHAVDTTGAGDAFVGTFATALGAGLAPPEAVRLGCVAGALSVQRPGTQTSYPSASEVVRQAG
jgi:ribokinase